MKTLIIYTSHHGCTENAAQMLQKQLKGDIIVVNLNANSNPKLGEADRIILGGSIHAGSIQGKMKRFCDKNKKALLSKPLGLFLCCMYEGETAEEQFNNAFPESLRTHAHAHGLFGGAFDFSKMNFFERKIIEKIAKTKENVSTFDESALSTFAQKF